MAQFDRYLLLGTVNGELFIIESSFFMRKGQESRCLVRNYTVCDSPITSLEVREDVLYLSSERGEGIIKVRLSLEEAWEFPELTKDRYGDGMTAEVLQARLNNVYSKRRKMQIEEEV